MTFDHPDWGTTVTLALFAISDVLDAAGTATLDPAGRRASRSRWTVIWTSTTSWTWS